MLLIPERKQFLIEFVIVQLCQNVLFVIFLFRTLMVPPLSAFLITISVSDWIVESFLFFGGQVVNTQTIFRFD